MSNRNSIPDAWDDDYEAVADAKSSSQPSDVTSSQGKVSRAERKAQHQEANKQLWDSAEHPEPFHFIDTKNQGPAVPNFKPALKVLSRKPKPANPASGNIQSGVQSLNMQDEEDDSEEEERKARERDLAEKQKNAAKERAEKERKYAEARERILGSSEPGRNDTTGRNSPTRGGRNQKARSRGNGRAQNTQRDNARSPSSADQSPARPPAQLKQLYDPDSVPKQSRLSSQYRYKDGMDGVERPIRNPRGPDGSGRGGFGFVANGSRSSDT